MQSKQSIVVVLGTGGTIAGTAMEAGDNVGYTAAQLGVQQLVDRLPALAGNTLETEQVAQLDSKDMNHATWRRLAERCAFHLARGDVGGIVVTHGTDTMEETAWFLQRVLAPRKPVVLTGAMRPATSLQSDGAQNLADALCVAREPGARGVVVAMAGQVHGAHEVRKRHPYRLDALGSGDAGPLGLVEEGALRMYRSWPEGEPLGLAALPEDASAWPQVDVLMSHAGARGALVHALCEAGARGIVVAGTGNGTVHESLDTALQAAEARGVRVWRSTRCNDGRVIETDHDVFEGAGELTPAKARVELMLQLMGAVNARR